MIEFAVKLKILKDILTKKEQALTQIANICENQGLLFMQPPSDERSLFLRETSSEKQQLVETVIECDDVFQKIFNEIRDGLEESAQDFRPQIIVLQNLIKSVTELDVKIRVTEQKNKAMLTEKSPKPIDANNVFNKNYILKQYKKNAKPFDGDA